MQKVGRYAEDLTPIQGDIVSKVEKRILNMAVAINKNLSPEITSKTDRARQVVSKINVDKFVQDAKDEYLSVLANKVESPPNEFMAVIGNRTYVDEASVHSIVKRLLDNGYGIASGGATGAEHYALTGNREKVRFP